MNRSFWAAIPQTQHQLQQLQDYLLKTIDLPDQPIHIKILKLLQSGGKFLRPGTFFLFAGLGPNQDTSQLLAGASAQEWVHLAVRFHDDVSDDKLTIPHLGQDRQQRNDIYAGDYLFTRYFEEILKTTPSPADFTEHLNVVQRILSGHFDQLQHRFDLTQTVPDYLTEINQRTGEAFRFSAQCGAKIAGADAEVVSLSAKLGAAMGNAYQVAQDIQLTFNDAKGLLARLQNGQYPLPVILALNQASIQRLLMKQQELTLGDIKSLQAQLDATAAQEQLQRLTAHTHELLNQLPAGDPRNDIQRFIDQLVKI
ncbi:geranylgeranyl pyrophosphate synthase [Secundilactobacillus pentosiphilus]|uniref:Geranylgeranyl pyrophosphate synthase n=1 Tax=Secundilactobacillus pentosiphilus TaxID=1714682 RepID=A0A1Z5IPX1_9LACO|nr:polyprenyl synthetase family protein [Secundilactobacillus pentosiphilus]GAX03809.1 geranylgeranyl pyrophosphate synthase [Secundilactobacillus pentosiphilus]